MTVKKKAAVKQKTAVAPIIKIKKYIDSSGFIDFVTNEFAKNGIINNIDDWTIQYIESRNVDINTYTIQDYISLRRRNEEQLKLDDSIVGVSLFPSKRRGRPPAWNTKNIDCIDTKNDLSKLFISASPAEVMLSPFKGLLDNNQKSIVDGQIAILSRSPKKVQKAACIISEEFHDASNVRIIFHEERIREQSEIIRKLTENKGKEFEELKTELEKSKTELEKSRTELKDLNTKYMRILEKQLETA